LDTDISRKKLHCFKRSCPHLFQNITGSQTYYFLSNR